jgi:hypothetical protein
LSDPTNSAIRTVTALYDGLHDLNAPIAYDASGEFIAQRGVNSMQSHSNRDEYMTAQSVPDDWAKLIRKLRWIGREDDANRLQQAICTLRFGTTEVAAPLITTE